MLGMETIEVGEGRRQLSHGEAKAAAGGARRYGALVGIGEQLGVSEYRQGSGKLARGLAGVRSA
jgi:hypothetical protein